MIIRRISLIALVGALFSLTALGIFEKKDEDSNKVVEQGALLPPPAKIPQEPPKSSNQLSAPNTMEDWDNFDWDGFNKSQAETMFNPFGE